MKKNIKIIYLILILNLIYSCAGYEPIFKSSSLNFKIEEYKLEGDKDTANKIYSSLKRAENYKANNNDATLINFFITTSKTNTATIKDSTGKIKEYKITLKAKIKVSEYLGDNILINETFEKSSSYKVQDNYSDTVTLENKSLQNLTDTIFQNLLNKLSVKISN